MKIGTFGVAMLLALSANAEPEDHSVPIKAQDADMVAAIRQAQATLDEFLKIAANPPEGASKFRLKVKITDRYGTEHFWIIPFKQVASDFVGIVADEPEYVKSVKYGQRISFTRPDITDWGYVLKQTKG